MGEHAQPGSRWEVFARALRDLPDPVEIPAPVPPLVARRQIVVWPPGSKSLTNRVLLLAALASGTSRITNALTEADDAHVMLAALRRLGAVIEHDTSRDGDSVLVIQGVGGRWKLGVGEEARLDLGNAGTATRFLAAAALLAPRSTSIVIDGDPRMRERPIGELASALRTLGARVEWLGREGYPPLRVWGMSGEDGDVETTTLPDEVAFGQTQSSQFISAVMLIAPWLRAGRGLRVHVGGDGDITSESYIDMTAGLLRRVGSVVRDETRHGGSARTFAIGGAGLPGFVYDVEPDASGATYFLAAGALVPGLCVRVAGLAQSPRSLQGDADFAGELATMGCIVTHDDGAHPAMALRGPEGGLRAISTDLSNMPDTAMTLAVVCCFAHGVSEIRGLRTLRVKETDRLEALRVELSKIGARVEIITSGDEEGLRITPPAQMDDSRVEFDTYKDHRMAMSLALVGLRRKSVWIRDPACVAKTYPTFWRQFGAMMQASEAGESVVIPHDA
jgi:3-phosphoshikimate 1-carboxyvinyltransferase